LARFIVLKGQSNYAVFDFDGNIARVGSGANVDLRLEGGPDGDDFFFLTKTASGTYQLEPRSAVVKISVNGSPCTGTTVLDDGSKIAVLGYMILVSYQAGQAEDAEQKPAPAAEATPEVAPVSDSTSPVKPMESAPNAPEVPPEPAPPKPTPPPAVERPTVPAMETPQSPSPVNQPPATPEPPPAPQGLGANDATVRINFDEVNQQVVPRKKEPAVEEVQGKIEPIFSLVCLSGYHKGKVFRIDSEEFVIGRDRDSDIVIDHDEKGRPDTSVSRKHFTVHSTEDGLFIVDKVSKLRTFVNGRVLESDQREQIAPEDIISIPSPQGDIKFRLCFVDEENFAPVEANRNTMWLIVGLIAVIIILAVAWIVFL
jgi:hypothetical protein